MSDTRNHRQDRAHVVSGAWILSALLILATAVLIIVYLKYIDRSDEVDEIKNYSRYYAIVTANRDSSMWKSLYQGAADTGHRLDTCVEMLGSNLSQDYSAADLMRIAIASRVDGIIVEADESEEITQLINEAVESDIPVVTLYGDCPQSERCSFVGISSYDLGKEYGRQIIKLAGEKHFTNKQIDVAVLVNAHSNDAGQNLVYLGIQDTISKEAAGMTVDPANIALEMRKVDDASEFSIEESVRDMFIREKESLPDIFVCLNETSTTSVYQAVVDYNKVGQVNILGYYDSEAILNAIDRGVIFSTVSVDTAQMGGYCIDALIEYSLLGYTSQYFTANVTLIDRSNVEAYLKGGDGHE